MFTALKSCSRFLAVICLGALTGCGNNSEKITYYVQLIRGNNNSEPPTPDSIAIGPKLSAKLHAVFSWTNYWEIARQEVAIAAGQKARVRLTSEREVEISLATKGQRTVTAFAAGESVGTTTQGVGEEMTIFGGDRENKTSWFIVIRRNKPSTD